MTSKTHVVKNKHITMRRDIDKLFVSPEHSAKGSYGVLTRDHRYKTQNLWKNNMTCKGSKNR